ncbi:MAG: bifunctional demethylmenaquinone methyltransferase/2-methoxy-6-polyprenyl-1,4-benzoquinol methylase UbiE [Thermodesulfobacteriota bacterium]|nr:bifunctional demethylmenaquinone methyltransferase/2-methoxy-6-polyprenyl-1,4-benzoquinol methylase UbiE [Thermodesulfobacteriota bacterium]
MNHIDDRDSTVRQKRVEMMIRDKNIWHKQETERVQPKNHPDREKTVTFGFQQIPKKEKVIRTIRHFNTVASKYDFMNTLLSFGIHYLWKRTAIEMMHLKPGDRVLDVCGGTGDLAVLAAGSVDISGKIIIYDINRKMMQVGCAKRNCPAQRNRIEFIQGDAESISFADEAFDAAMVGFGIRNLTHMDVGFQEMHRVLKPGGIVMCLEFSKPTASLFRWLYDVYSFHVMPLLGQVLVGSRQAYTLLPESIRMFPLPEALSELLRDIGFHKVVYRRLTNGIAVVHVAEKL